MNIYIYIYNIYIYIYIEIYMEASKPIENTLIRVGVVPNID